MKALTKLIDGNAENMGVIGKIGRRFREGRELLKDDRPRYLLTGQIFLIGICMLHVHLSDKSRDYAQLFIYSVLLLLKFSELHSGIRIFKFQEMTLSGLIVDCNVAIDAQFVYFQVDHNRPTCYHKPNSINSYPPSCLHPHGRT